MKTTKSDNKYLSLIKEIDNKDVNWFTEEIGKLISDLNNETTTRKYEKEDWEEIYKKTKDKNIPLANRNAIKVALLKTKYLPQDIKTKMIKNIHKGYLHLAFKRDDNTYEQIEIMTKRAINFYSSNFFHLDAINQSSMELMAKLPEEILQKIEYKPLRYVKGKEWNDKIYCMLVNKYGKLNYDLDENFLTEVANNENLSTLTRNLAFKLGYVAEKINFYTKTMSLSLYNQAIETLYIDEIYNEKEQEKAEFILKKIIKNDVLGETESKDLVILAIDKMDKTKQNSYILENLLKTTKYEDVINDTIAYTDKNTVSSYLFCNENLNDKQFAKLLEKSEQYKTILIKEHGNRKRLNDEIFEKYYKEDNIGLIYMCNINTPKHIEQKIIEEIGDKINVSGVPWDKFCNKKEKYEILLAIRYMKEQLMQKNDILSNEDIAVILDFMLHSICRKDQYIQEDSIYKELLRKEQYSRSLKNLRQLNLNKEKIDTIKGVVRDVNKMYPNNHYFYNNFLCDLVIMVKDSYKEKGFFYEHDDIYSFKKEFSIYSTQMDIEKLYNYSDDKREQFIKDIKNIENKDLLKEVKGLFVDKFKIISIDDLYRYIYKLSDVYNAMKEKIKEMEERNVEENEITI